MRLQENLAAGILKARLDIDAYTQVRLLDYLALLHKWNKVHNLTAVRELQAMVTLHLLDSLSILPHLRRGRLLDVGSGAGLPGIPLALARPDLHVTVIDASHKKASFMRQAKGKLGIPNLEVICGRVEQLRTVQPFDMIVSRAFSDLAKFVRLTRHLLSENGCWLAMKGVHPAEEIARLSGLTVDVVALQVPGLAAQRHLVFLQPVKEAVAL